MAIWVEEKDPLTAIDPDTGEPYGKAIRGVVPRDCQTASERAWRTFVRTVQRHDCRQKCHYTRGEFQGKDFCKYLYPRNTVPLKDSPRLNTADQRYEYECEEAEDGRISPYVTLWLLAWVSANANANTNSSTQQHCHFTRRRLESGSATIGIRWRPPHA